MALLDVWTLLSAAFVVTNVKGANRLVQKQSVSVFKELIIEDIVTDIAIIGKQSVLIHEEFTVRVSCNGSSPFNISWNLASLSNRSSVYEDKVLDIESCNHSIFHKFSSAGDYILTITIENPVDIESAIFRISATSAMTTVMPDFRPSAVVPVLSVVVAIVATVALAWSYARSHRAAQVETADFEFYTPSNTSMPQFQSSYGSMEIVSHNYHRLVHSTKKSSGEKRASEAVELRLLSEPLAIDSSIVISEELSLC